MPGVKKPIEVLLPPAGYVDYWKTVTTGVAGVGAKTVNVTWWVQPYHIFILDFVRVSYQFYRISYNWAAGLISRDEVDLYLSIPGIRDGNGLGVYTPDQEGLYLKWDNLNITIFPGAKFSLAAILARNTGYAKYLVFEIKGRYFLDPEGIWPIGEQSQNVYNYSIPT
jgi:hypothetical protein